MEKQYNKKKQYIIIFMIVLAVLKIIWLFFGEKFSEWTVGQSVFVWLHTYTGLTLNADLIYKITALALLFGILFCIWQKEQ